MGELIMKNQIIAFVTGTINACTKFQDSDTMYILNGVLDYIADIKEEVSSDGEAIYVKRIVELEAENEELKDAQSITLSTNNEMSNALWNSVCLKLTEENVALQLKNEKLEKELIHMGGTN